ncbi:hypothetical protein Vretimale_15225 [Volvox reticuliferus]|uniref:Reverse transcriptase RNase H-like domain-containing protein n=1 Tax=Volvox reticuliferus TaxID=1737510 RepID=A0A8J4GQT9_9CHLO|nr:hypothetical protein Vretimale_15225 [Volvox reticuliferus]
MRVTSEVIVLRSLDNSLPMSIEVAPDASLEGTGAELLQKGKPVVFLSRKFSVADCKNTMGEQELLAVMHALREWCCCVERHAFGIKTDHNPSRFCKVYPL